MLTVYTQYEFEFIAKARVNKKNRFFLSYKHNIQPSKVPNVKRKENTELNRKKNIKHCAQTHQT